MVSRVSKTLLLSLAVLLLACAQFQTAGECIKLIYEICDEEKLLRRLRCQHQEVRPAHKHPMKHKTKKSNTLIMLTCEKV